MIWATCPVVDTQRVAVLLQTGVSTSNSGSKLQPTLTLPMCEMIHVTPARAFQIALHSLAALRPPDSGVGSKRVTKGFSLNLEKMLGNKSLNTEVEQSSRDNHPHYLVPFFFIRKTLP